MGLCCTLALGPSNVRGRPADKNKTYFILILIKEKGDIFLLFLLSALL